MATLKKIVKSAPRMRGVTPVPNGPLIKKKGPFKGSSLKKGGVVKAQNGSNTFKISTNDMVPGYKAKVVEKTDSEGVRTAKMKVRRTIGGLLLGKKKGKTINVPAYNVPQFSGSSNSPFKVNPERKDPGESPEGTLRKTKNGGKLKIKYKK